MTKVLCDDKKCKFNENGVCGRKKVLFIKVEDGKGVKICCDIKYGREKDENNHD